MNPRVTMAFVIGVVFAAGLGLSGMANPFNILAFLDITGGHWDPTLMFVMGGAILAHAPFVRLAKARAQPWRADRFAWPTTKDVDAKLVVGSAIFGVGWGLSGFCPGPSLVGVGSLYVYTIVFVAAVVVGAVIGRAIANAMGSADQKK